MRMTSRKQLLNIAMSCHDLTSGVAELTGGRGFDPRLGHELFRNFSLDTQACARLDSVSKEELCLVECTFSKISFRRCIFRLCRFTCSVVRGRLITKNVWKMFSRKSPKTDMEDTNLK